MARLAMPVIRNEGLASVVNPHFGKSKGFLLVNADGTNVQYLNSDDIRLEGECAPVAGLVEAGAQALLCVGMGGGALARCQGAGLSVYQCPSGATVEQVLEGLASGRKAPFPEDSLCDHDHNHDHNHDHRHACCGSSGKDR